MQRYESIIFLTLNRISCDTFLENVFCVQTYFSYCCTILLLLVNRRFRKYNKFIIFLNEMSDLFQVILPKANYFELQ